MRTESFCKTEQPDVSRLSKDGVRDRANCGLRLVYVSVLKLIFARNVAIDALGLAFVRFGVNRVFKSTPRIFSGRDFALSAWRV
jgi:hypothetical protein